LKALRSKNFKGHKGFCLSPWYTGEAHVVIAMSQPWKHPDTGVLYCRGRVPAELIDRLKSQKLTVRVGDTDRTVTIAPWAVT
jgi:hypothetical protein